MTSLIRYSGPLDLTGLPAIALPAGVGRDGLPIGAQLAGPAFGERRVLQVAHALEQVVQPRLAAARPRQEVLVPS